MREGATQAAGLRADTPPHPPTPTFTPQLPGPGRGLRWGGKDLLCSGDHAERGRILQLPTPGWEHLAPAFSKGGEGREKGES